jgi:hypothetical protein
MQSVIKLLPNATDDRTVSGDFIYVDSATAVFSVKVDDKWVYLLNQGDQIKMPVGMSFTSIEVSDLSGQQNNIKLRYGFGSLQPRVDHKKVDITALPAMTLANDQSVSVNNFPAVQKVSVEQGQSLSVSNLPVVQKVSIEQGQSLSVSNLPVVQKVSIEQGQSVSVKSAGNYTPLAPADFSVADVVVAANANRQTLVILADEQNVGKIWVGGVNVGIPLIPGQPFNLSTSAAITLHAETNADKCYLAEIAN